LNIASTGRVAARLKSHDFSPIEMSLGEPQGTQLADIKAAFLGSAETAPFLRPGRIPHSAAHSFGQGWPQATEGAQRP
jgi:hypothetical protein